MAGAMRKMAVYLGLVEDDRYEDRYAAEYGPDEDYADEDYDSSRREDTTETAVPAPRSSTPVLERRTTDLARITTLHPRTYNEARTIGEHFRGHAGHHESDGDG